MVKYRYEKIRGFSVLDILNTISATEDLLFNEDSKNDKKIIILGDYLISENFIDKDITPSFFKKRQFFFSFKDALWGKFFAHKVCYPCRADIVRVKNNLRAFYLSSERPFCTKILIGGVRKKEDMKNEIDTRAKVSRLNVLNVPEIFATNVDFDHPFFIEEFINGKKVDIKKDKALIIGAVEGLWKMYEARGISFIKITDIFPTNSIAKIKEAVREMGVAESLNGFNRLENGIVNLLEDTRLVPSSFCHGDFSVGNMIVFKDSIYVIDWEKSKKMPIAFDLEKITESVEGIYQKCEQYMKLLQKKHDINMLPFRKQLALGIIEKIILYDETKKYYEFIGRDFSVFKKDFIKYLDHLNLLINSDRLKK